jgi:hypothetical protein
MQYPRQDPLLLILKEIDSQEDVSNRTQWRSFETFITPDFANGFEYSVPFVRFFLIFYIFEGGFDSTTTAGSSVDCYIKKDTDPEAVSFLLFALSKIHLSFLVPLYFPGREFDPIVM